MTDTYKGNKYEHIEYTPYGEFFVEEKSDSFDRIPFRFAAKEWDEETKLYYYGARYMDPRTSRWISSDPAGFELANPNNDRFNLVESYNHYSYTSNNPVIYTDPSGMFLEALAQGIMDFTLWICGAETQALSDMVNVDNLADEIINNSSALDSKTQAMVDGMSRDEVIDHLNGVRVMSNVNEGVYNFFTGLFGLEANGTASGIGNVIYDRGADFAGNFALGGSDAEGAANLLGHEAIHTLQASAHGGLASFSRAYSAAGVQADANGDDPYFGNEFEIAAYSFGPAHGRANQYLPAAYKGNSILTRRPGWWR